MNDITAELRTDDLNTFPNLIISNLITGCTTLINEALAVKALPISDKAIMHDWWLAIVAAAFGKVIFLDMPPHFSHLIIHL